MGQDTYLFLWYCQCLNRSLTEKDFLTRSIQTEQSIPLVVQKCLPLSSTGIQWASVQNLFKRKSFGVFLPKVTQISRTIEIWCQVKITKAIFGRGSSPWNCFPRRGTDTQSSINCDLNQSQCVSQCSDKQIISQVIWLLILWEEWGWIIHFFVWIWQKEVGK